ncbi:MAG: adenylosuccinate synthetase [marine bacterium B5-7]|nr:MAG: adenylosuccinate synthetase [marine bacterium B5-7]
MPVSVVVGGQYGSEAKGKVANYLIETLDATCTVRVGGSNSGHTVYDKNKKIHILRQLPSGSVLPNVLSVLPAGSYISIDQLLLEIKRLDFPTSRLAIDPNAFILMTEHSLQESRSKNLLNIGSTLSGTGAAVSDRINRSGGLVLARDVKSIRDMVKPVLPILRERLDRGERIIVEGTQGYGLSVLHSPFYPFVTSRDTTASAVLSEVGLSPLDVDDVTLVLRTFPIRGAGTTGPLPQETNWETVTKSSNSKMPITENTSVTKKLRRVAYFDSKIVVSAIAANSPTRIVMNHVDYVDRACFEQQLITDRASNFLSSTEQEIGRKIDLVGIGPNTILPR